MKILNAMMLVCCMLSACQSNTPSNPTPPVVTDSAKCSDACVNLKNLGCEEGNPIDMHTSCETDSNCGSGQVCSALGKCMVTCEKFCKDSENQGVWMMPGCVAAASSCEAIQACTVNASTNK
jgi:hypothetical protein